MQNYSLQNGIPIPEHVTHLNHGLPKNRRFPIALKTATSLLIEEQPDLVPIYGGGIMNRVEHQVPSSAGQGYVTDDEKRKACGQIDKLRGNVTSLVHGMREWDDSYSTLMALNNDLKSDAPAIIDPNLPPYRFQIWPKTFALGLTGRLLQDEQGKQFTEQLTVSLDICDAYLFARAISPKRILAVQRDGKGVLIYKNRKETELTEYVASKGKATYICDPLDKENLPLSAPIVLPSDFRPVASSCSHQLREYQRTILFGHSFPDMNDFLAYTAAADDHLLWKLAASKPGSRDSCLIDLCKTYPTFKGQPRYENQNRLQVKKGEASVVLDGLRIRVGKPHILNALSALGDVLRDLWMDAQGINGGTLDDWDIVFDRSRGISPQHPVRVSKPEQFKKYAVIKK